MGVNRQRPDPEVGDHFRPVDGDLPAGAYRVVGTPGDEITLLRVGDAEGRRVHTGDVRRVPRERLADFEPAANPDGNQSMASTVASRLEGVAWKIRVIGQAMRANPGQGAVAVALVLVGVSGEAYLPGPEWAFTAATMLGALAIVYVGQWGP